MNIVHIKTSYVPVYDSYEHSEDLVDGQKKGGKLEEKSAWFARAAYRQPTE